MFGNRYRGRKVLVTGHTGFKGSWLCLWLTYLGAEVTGVSLPETESPNHWELLGLGINDRRVDIRDRKAVEAVIEQAAPEVLFHLAAQSLVRRSYRDPLDTWSTNVIGTANVLQACRKVPVAAVIVVTTDKVYANHEWPWPYRENDRLGGYDPYSASKAACEIVVDSFRKSFFENAGTLVASARAGNVIGGGDWGEDRLIPDAIRAISSKQPLVVRSPSAVRPWQHVLECTAGYLLLGQKLLEGDRQFASAWNFGPDAARTRTVQQVIEAMKESWPELKWYPIEADKELHETSCLYLDASKARVLMNWNCIWSIEQTLSVAIQWYHALSESGRCLSSEQLALYIEDARKGALWAQA